MEPTEQNRRAWEEAHRRRREALGGAPGLPHQVRRSLAGLAGKRVLDLQSGAGESAAVLAELGAMVTALDASEQALAIARERWPTILWIQGDLQALPGELRRGRFDLVYTGEGVVESLHDLDGWAQGVASALRAGGDLLVFDEHPAAKCVDGLMHWRENYFEERSTPGAARPGVHDRQSHRWRLGQIVSAVAREGLVVKALEEYPQQAGNPRHQDARLPGTFLLHARRP